MAEYMVLRNAAAVRTAGPFETFGPTAAGAGAPPAPHLEVHDIATKDLTDVARDPSVAAVAPSIPTIVIKPLAEDAGAAATTAWGIGAVKADTSSRTGDGTVVSVLDTGIDKTHPAFAGVTIVEQDFTGTGNGDVQGHGTHCAGTIFGRDVGGTRIGVARGVNKALIGKILGNDGRGSSQMMFQGMQWALNQGAHVISMSLGFDFPGLVKRLEVSGMATEAAVSTSLEGYRANLLFLNQLMGMIKAAAAFAESPVVIAAAGNESKRPTYTVGASVPAVADGVVAVAAAGEGAGGAFNIATFSNTFAQVTGPGVNILSAKTGGGLQSLSGTSMACPHVAGVAALWWEDLRKKGLVRPSASMVAQSIVTGARPATFAAGISFADRGSGMVTSPA